MKKTKQIQSQKDISQNRRNRLINRYYLILIKKTLKKYKSLLLPISIDEKSRLTNKEWKIMVKETGSRQEISKQMISKLFSLYDKAVKKRIIHKNTAARKKSRLQKIYNQVKWFL